MSKKFLGAIVGTLVALGLVFLMDTFLNPSPQVSMPISFVLGMGCSMIGMRLVRKP